MANELQEPGLIPISPRATEGGVRETESQALGADPKLVVHERGTRRGRLSDHGCASAEDMYLF